MSEQHTIGIDISKHQLDVFCFPGGKATRFDNTAQGHKALVKWIDPQVERIVYEPTGAYHRALEEHLDQAGLPLVKVNPRQAKRFGEACGKQAKTDPIDAAMLARMGATLPLEPKPLASKEQRQLKELQAARQSLVKSRTALSNQLQSLTLPLLKRQVKARLSQIERHIKALDKQISALVKADPDLSRKHQILLSIPGIATITAVALLAHMPELGTLSGKQAAALAGLAPITRQSGKWQGKAHIKGGRAELRHALYMPAMVAVRFNPALKDNYQNMIERGKPAKIALTAAMRKIVTTANALIRDDRIWTQNQP